jgi:hypothetical protein
MNEWLHLHVPGRAGLRFSSPLHRSQELPGWTLLSNKGQVIKRLPAMPPHRLSCDALSPSSVAFTTRSLHLFSSAPLLPPPPLTPFSPTVAPMAPPTHYCTPLFPPLAPSTVGVGRRCIAPPTPKILYRCLSSSTSSRRPPLNPSSEPVVRDQSSPGVSIITTGRRWTRANQ